MYVRIFIAVIESGGGYNMEIDDELKPLTVNSYEVSPAMHDLIKHLLKVIPDSYLKDFPPVSFFESRLRWDARGEESTIYCDRGLLRLSVDVAIGTLAHDFARVYLGHKGKGSLQDENAADELASQWGFANEVAAMRKSSGPPD
jgi:hypothetical protein